MIGVRQLSTFHLMHSDHLRDQRESHSLNVGPTEVVVKIVHLLQRGELRCMACTPRGSLWLGFPRKLKISTKGESEANRMGQFKMLCEGGSIRCH